MNLQQIATGNYTSLVGTWTAEAYAENRQDGNGFQWMPGGPDTLVISDSGIVNATQGMQIQGSTLTYKSMPEALTFQVDSNYAMANLVNQDVGTNWALEFFPKGFPDLDSMLQTNNGVSLDNSKNTIYIFESDSYMQVFSQTSTSGNSPTTTAPAAGQDVGSQANMQQIATGDLSSIQGVWKNSAGSTITISGSTMNPNPNPYQGANGSGVLAPPWTLEPATSDDQSYITDMSGQVLLTEEGTGGDVDVNSTLVVLQKGTALENVDVNGVKYPDPTEITEDRLISFDAGGGGQPCPDSSCAYYRA